MDAYEWAREKVDFLLKRLESVAVDELDMFSDAPAAGTVSNMSFSFSVLSFFQV